MEKYCRPGDRRAVHLRLTDAAAADGQRTQVRPLAELCKDLNGEQPDALDECLRQISVNVRAFFAGGAEPCR